MNAQALKPWLVPAAIVAGAGVALYVLFRVLKGAAAPTIGESASTGGGLVNNAIGGLFGFGQSSSTVGEAVLELGNGSLHVPTPDPESTDPLEFISGGIVDPPHEGTVRRIGYGTQTVRLKAELSNASSSDWTGALRLEVYEDYLSDDEQGAYSKVVTVPAGSTAQFDIDYALQADFILREPNLFIQVFAGTKHLGPHTVYVS